MKLRCDDLMNRQSVGNAVRGDECAVYHPQWADVKKFRESLMRLKEVING